MSKHLAYGLEITVPAPVLEHRQRTSGVLRQLPQLLRLIGVSHKCFLDNQVFTAQQRFLREVVMRVRGRIHNHEVDPVIGQQFVQRIIASRRWIILTDEFAGPLPAARQVETGMLVDKRGMKESARHSE